MALAVAGAALLGAAAVAPDGAVAQEQSVFVPQLGPPSFDELTVAAERASQTGKRQELRSLRDGNSTTWINTDGSTTVETTEVDTRVRRDGEWVDIDTSLADIGKVLKPKTVEADVAISDGVGAEPLAKVSDEGRSLSLDWKNDLPAPDLESGSATFEDTSSRDVQVTATSDGFNVHILLDKAPTTAPVYRLPVGAKGVRLSKTDSGQFVAVDTATGEPAFWIDKPVAWDGTQQNLEAGPEVVVDVDAQLETDADGGQLLVLRPSFDWLKADTTVYPVQIDPDVYTDTRATRATYVASRTEDNPNDGVNTAYNVTNFSTATMLRTGWQSEYRATRTYLEWDDVARPGTVIKADLRLYQYDATTCTPTALSIYPVTQEWWADDHPTQTGPLAGVTYTSTAGKHGQPAIDWNTPYETSKTFVHGSDASCSNGFGPNAYETIDVTALVKAWDEGYPNYGMALRAAETSGSETAYKGFCSRNISTAASATSCYDGANPPAGRAAFSIARTPTLIVTYNTAPSVTFNTQVLPSTCTDGNVPRAASASPTLWGVANDVDSGGSQTMPDGSPNPDYGHEKIKLHYEIWPGRAVDYLDPSFVPADDPEGPMAMIAQGDSSFVEQGTLASWAVPSGKLAEGGSYAWRAVASDGTDTSTTWSNWDSFVVDTAATPQANCTIDALDADAADSAAQALVALADRRPDRYAGLILQDGNGLELLVVPHANETTAAAIADATADARSALQAAAGLTPEQRLNAQSVLTVRIVTNSKTTLEAVKADIGTQNNAADPRFDDLVSWGIDVQSDLVDIGLDGATAAELNAITALYPGKVKFHEEAFGGGELALNFPPPNRGTDFYAGVELRRYDTGKTYRCTLGPALSGQTKRYGATAGHCGAKGVRFSTPAGTAVGEMIYSKSGKHSKFDIGVIENPNITGSSVPFKAMAEGYRADDPKTVAGGYGKLYAGQYVCKYGASTGPGCSFKVASPDPTCVNNVRFGRDEYCGRIKAVSTGAIADYTTNTEKLVAEGDSGGPVYVKLNSGPNQGRVGILGIITNSGPFVGSVGREPNPLPNDSFSLNYYPSRTMWFVPIFDQVYQVNESTDPKIDGGLTVARAPRR